MEIHKKDILSKDIEFVRGNVDQGQRLLILDPSRKTIQFFFRIGIMCILKETLPSVLRTKTKGSELGSISLPRRNEIYLVADCKNQ